MFTRYFITSCLTEHHIKLHPNKKLASVLEFTHGAIGSSDRSLMVEPLSYFSFQPECSTTGVAKAVVCAIMSVG